MKCARQGPRSYWINFGKRAAAGGHSLEWLITPIKPEATQIRAWLQEGFEAETRRLQRRAARKIAL